MAVPKDRSSPLAVALEWVSRITAVALVMVVPGLAGYWLDTKLGTGFLMPAGFVFGIVVGMYSLLALTGALAKRSSRAKGIHSDKNQEDQQT
jgi:Putative F0F1-ATPase subunit Ca2+/Mg2+ transporter